MKNRIGTVAAVSAFLCLLFFFVVMSGREKASEAATKPSINSIPLDVPLYKEGELLVQMNVRAGLSASVKAHSLVGAEVIRKIRSLDGGPDIELVKLPRGMSVPAALQKYRSNRDVFHAEPNAIRRATQTFPDDPLFGGFLWGLNNTGQTNGTIDADIDAPEAWDLTTGDPNVVVAVVDTGIFYDHPDLWGNMWRNIQEAEGVYDVDDDGNGFVDDIYEIDTVNNDSDPADDFGHGTHVAGTLGAVGNNSEGVVGVNWDVEIMALKFISGTTETGTVADEIDCLNYIALMVDRGVNVVAVNASYGGFFPGFTFEQAAINNLRERGVLFIGAAGNEAVDNDGLFNFPSSYDLPNIIAVAATNHNDQLATFSSFGRRTVHVGAPGVNIVSTLWPANPGDPLYGDFLIPWSGTSMAAPHVTGTVGLLYARFPLLDPLVDWDRVRNRILSSGDLDPFLVGRTMTGRRLNAFNSLTCSSSELLARIRPATSEYKTWIDAAGTTLFFTIVPGSNFVTAIFGENPPGNFFSLPLRLSALHINCDSPAGNVDITIGDNTVTLLDNGIAPDLVAGDGVYSGEWSPPFSEGSATARFPNVGTSVTPTNDAFTVVVRKTEDPLGFVVADAGRNRSVREGRFVELDGSISSGSLDVFTPLVFQWTQTEGTTVSLADATTPFPSFTAPGFVAPTPLGQAQPLQEDTNDLRFQLTVSDLEGNVATDSVRITITQDTSDGGGGGGGGGSSCFIATAAYGSGSSHDVMALRQFRDEYLLTNAPGRALVQVYYKHSPPAASFIASRPLLKTAVRIGLQPAVAFARVMLETTPTQKFLISGLLCLIAAGSVAVVRGRKRMHRTADTQ
ncbi:MAG: hypothetical protein C4532_00415 [Candidatus Abyssobacteria bacterium SURF_17]|uniref:Uncharacterized protein n=1 Tax=Candidatus Abyssobacteria bacterium SURF_17 TaxID=2093361 RepID=A0A419F9M1_9BACT|nr:MAG: hypothetical protein C4532_00415 [Candidatus Abyssubacteria bacterium SURF_17]